ncbi:MAG: DUF2267 domain-containing protein [Lysobacteraceae bacterium]
MPIPSEYADASRVFESFMVEARNASGLHTTNMAWNMVVGVFQAFRRRLEVHEAVRFAGALPAGLRSLFVADWDPSQPRVAYGDPDAIIGEVRSVRAAHNFSPDHAREAVAVALWHHVDRERVTDVLASISPEALRFWQVDAQRAESLREVREPLIRHAGDVPVRPGFDPLKNP